MIKTITLLENDVVRLRPFEDIADFYFLLSLIEQYRYTMVGKNDAKDVLVRFGEAFWVCYDQETGQRGGVVYLSNIPGLGYTLDAYRDDELYRATMKTSSGQSYFAGKLVLEYFFEKMGKVLFTSHRSDNRAATIVCKRLGFKEVSRYDSQFGEFVMLIKHKEK